MRALWNVKLYSFLTDIEAQIREIQGKKAALDEAQGVGLDSTGYYDQEIYGGSDSRFAGYVTSIAATELEDVSCKRQGLFFLKVKYMGFFLLLLFELHGQKKKTMSNLPIESGLCCSHAHVRSILWSVQSTRAIPVTPSPQVITCQWLLSQGLELTACGQPQLL